MEWTSWDERWLKAYCHGPARVLVRDQRRLQEPLIITVAAAREESPTWKYPGNRGDWEPDAPYKLEDPDGI